MALALAAGFALLGLLAQRGRLWAFGVGAALYALDGLIVLAAHDWVAVTIHTVVLVMMVRGLDAGRRPSRRAPTWSGWAPWEREPSGRARA